jgi:hypothetical protein
MGAVTDNEPSRQVGFRYVRLWLGLFVVASVFEMVTGFAQNQRVTWPPSLLGPLLFASVWTGLRIAQSRYNAPR